MKFTTRMGDGFRVASKLGIPVLDIADPVVMIELRDDLDRGTVEAVPGAAKSIDAKFRVAEVLDSEIAVRERTK